MTFERREYIGREFPWFAIDKLGQIGRFTTGFGPVPSQIFESERVYSTIQEHMAKLPERSQVHFPQHESVVHRFFALLGTRESGIPKYDACYARRGIFEFFDDNDAIGTHTLFAAPLSPINVREFPEDIRAHISQLMVPKSFERSGSIDVESSFKCDRG